MSVESLGFEFYNRFVKRWRGPVNFFYPMNVHGKENIYDKPCIICANHSNNVDPLLVAIAFGPEDYIHFMAKAELFKVPVIGNLIIKLGSFGIDRSSSSSIGAIRTVMKYIRGGEKVMIFPEGTRVEEDGMAEAKSGAVRMAAKLKVPIQPVYITRNKKLFRKSQVVIGEPIDIPNGPDEDYHAIAEQLMKKISEMGRTVE